MNLIQEIENTFKENTHWDDFTKIRYIYLTICKTFSYDTTYFSENPRIQRTLYEKRVDIEDVKEFELVCTGINVALHQALTYFGYASEVVKEEGEEFQHQYTIVKCMNRKNTSYRIKLDPTKRHDVTRVKMGGPTLSFTDLDNHDDFTDCVEYADTEIAKVVKPKPEQYYSTVTIKELNNVINESAKNRGVEGVKLFLEKLDYIMLLINIRDDLTKFDDIDYFYSYLIRNFEMNVVGIRPFIMPAIFYNNNNYNDIITITLINHPATDPFVTVMYKENNRFQIKKISNEQALELLDKYFNIKCQHYFETQIQRAIKYKSR